MTKKAYLTIDDSPGKFMKEKVDFLNRRGIPALFFCRGDYMENYPEMIIYAIKKGFVIGNHTYSHKHFSDISTKECFDEISKTEKIIAHLYNEANVKRKTKYFRYPFGTKGNIIYGSLKIVLKQLDGKFRDVDKYLKEHGYQSLNIDNYIRRFPECFMMNDTDTCWTFDIGEWKMVKNNLSFSVIEKRLNDGLSNKSANEIFLVHDQESTHEYFEKIINHLCAKGYNFLAIN